MDILLKNIVEGDKAFMVKQRNRCSRKMPQYFKEAFLSLLADNEYDTITVKHICERVECSRVSFYNYYSDKAALFNEIIVEKLNGTLKSLNYSRIDDRKCLKAEMESWMIRLFEFIYHNSKFFQIMYTGNKFQGVFSEIYIIIRDFLNEKVLEKKGISTTLDMEREYYLYYLSSAILGVINCWISTGFKQTPKEMTNQLNQIFQTSKEQVFYHSHYPETGQQKEAHKDPRIRRTQKKIVNSLLKLVAEKPYKEITIKEIAEFAYCNRVTFYAHYSSKDHLLTKIVEAKNKGLSDSLNFPMKKNITEKNNYLSLFIYVKDNANYYSLLHPERRIGWVYKEVYKTFVYFYEKEIRSDTENYSDLPFSPEYYAHFIAGGMTGVLYTWAKEEFEKPMNELIEQLEAIELRRTKILKEIPVY